MKPTANPVRGPADAASSVLVLGSQRRESLTVIRSLAKAGYRVIVARCGVPGQGEFSRCCHEVWQLPRLSEGAAAAVWAALRGRLQSRPDIQWVFPVGDDEIHFCHRFADDFPETVRCIAVDRELAAICLSKQRLLETAAAADVAVERFEQLASGQDLSGALDRVGLPCVVKPLRGTDTLAGKKAVILYSAQDRAACLDHYAALEIPLLVQRFAQGTRHNVYFLADRGRLLATRQVRIVRTDRLDGTGAGRRRRLGPAVGRVAGRLRTTALRIELSWSGLRAVSRR